MQPDAGHFPRSPRILGNPGVPATGGVSITGKWPDLTINATLVNWIEGLNTAAPNATIPVHSFTPRTIATNADYAAVPTNNGAFLLAIPDNTAAGGNKRGLRAVDLSRNRSANTAVAAATDSFAAGTDITIGASATGGVGLGTGISVTAVSGFAAGQGHSNDAQYGTALGRTTANRGITGTLVFSSGAVSTNGDRQGVIFHGKCQTNDATTPVILTANNGAASVSNTWVLANNSCLAFVAYLTGRRATGDYATWKLEGSAARVATAGTTTVSVTGAAVSLGNIGTGATTTFTAAANLVNGSIEFSVTGFAAATTGQWSVIVISPEEVG